MPIAESPNLPTQQTAKSIRLVSSGVTIADFAFDGTADVEAELSLPAPASGAVDPADVEPIINGRIISFETLAALQADTESPDIAIVGGRQYLKIDTDPNHFLSTQNASGVFYEIATESVTSFDALRHKQEGQTDEDAIETAWRACYHNLNERHFIGMHDLVVEFDYDVLAGAYTDDEAADRASFDFAVQDGFKTTDDITFYNNHVAAIRNANGYHKVRNYCSSCDVHRTGTYILNLENRGLIDFFGYEEDRGFGVMSSVKGSGQHRRRIKQIDVAPHPTRGPNIYSITVTLADGQADLDTSLVVAGMCVDLGQHLTSAADPKTNATTALGGAALITAVTARTITFDYWDARTNGELTSTTDIINTGAAGEIDRPSGEIRINSFQWRILFNGNDRQQESSPGNQFGSKSFEQFFSYVDHQNYSMIRFGVPADPETKGRFVGNMSKYRGELMHYCGFSGRLVRLAINVDGILNNCAFGGLGVDNVSLGDRGIDGQLMSRFFAVRCSFSQMRDYGALLSSFSDGSLQSCNITNCEQGASAITSGRVDLSASIIQRCNTGGRIQAGGLMVINTLTKFVDCDTGLNVFNRNQISGGDPILLRNGVDYVGADGVPVKGGRITNNVMVFADEVTMSVVSVGVKTFTFAAPRTGQDYNVVVTLRERGTQHWEYIGLTGFRVRTFDIVGDPADLDFNFEYSDLE